MLRFSFPRQRTTGKLFDRRDRGNFQQKSGSLVGLEVRHSVENIVSQGHRDRRLIASIVGVQKYFVADVFVDRLDGRVEGGTEVNDVSERNVLALSSLTGVGDDPN